MLTGVNFVGIGVSDIDKSIKFYSEYFGFSEVMFDYTGSLPGMERVTNKSDTKARVAMLNNPNKGSIGLGMIKLVKLLSDIQEPCTVIDSTMWGDIGIAECCFHCKVSSEAIFSKLWQHGLRAALTPAFGSCPPYGTDLHYAYLRDPDNALLELIDYKMCITEPNSTINIEPEVEGVNHVGFGVSDMDKTIEFYKKLEFGEIIMDIPYEVSSYAMATMLPTPAPKMRIVMMANYQGAWIEPIQLATRPEPPALKKAWGHLGSMEFGVGVTNIEKAYNELQDKGISFLSTPQTVKVKTGEWKYAYVVEPDGIPVSIIEPRY